MSGHPGLSPKDLAGVPLGEITLLARFDENWLSCLPVTVSVAGDSFYSRGLWPQSSALLTQLLAFSGSATGLATSIRYHIRR